jgi:response regulator RpfG family c-di-GMP phosphodiesterase
LITDSIARKASPTEPPLWRAPGTLDDRPSRSASEVARVRLAARLHDVGKAAIPVAILDKPGPLDGREWELVRSHPVIGERIVLAAPELANTASLIRSSHERIGSGSVSISRFRRRLQD